MPATRRKKSDPAEVKPEMGTKMRSRKRTTSETENEPDVKMVKQDVVKQEVEDDPEMDIEEEEMMRPSMTRRTTRRQAQTRSTIPMASPTSNMTILTMATPTTSKATPSTSKTTPSSSKAIPSTGEATPSTSKATPSTSKATPSSSKATPSIGKSTPSTGKSTPSTGKATPSSNKAMFSSSKATPSTSKSTPSSGKAIPSTDEATPSTGEATPSTGEAIPSTSKATPSIGNATPSTSKATPSTGKATPSSGKATPSSSKANPSTSVPTQVVTPLREPQASGSNSHQDVQSTSAQRGTPNSDFDISSSEDEEDDNSAIRTAVTPNQSHVRGSNLGFASNESLFLEIPQALREKIWSNAFVDLSLMLASPTDEPSEFLLQVGSDNRLRVVPKTINRIHTIDDWTSAFIKFVGIYSMRFPYETPGLMKYMELVRELASYNHDFLSYDTQFRMLRTSVRYSWDKIHPEYWIKATMPIVHPRRNERSPSRFLPNTCWAYNKRSQCEMPNCPYPHVCGYCRGPHHAAICDNTI